ncbi:FtsW/RodA/SpoVE family cell cycle protein [Clostridium sp. Marseille-Q7071]
MDGISSYLEEVCSVIKCKEVHEEIKEEIRNHIEELALEYIDNGYSPDEAYKLAIRDVGDSGEIGFKLNKVYEKKIEYKTLIIGIVLSLFGIVVNFLITSNLMQSYENQTVKSIVCFLLGIGVFLGIYYFDYRKLEKYSYHIYGISTVVGLLSYISKSGMSIVRDEIMLGSLIMLLYLISISGIINNMDFKYKNNIFRLIGMFILSNYILFLEMNKIYAVIFTFVFIVLTIKNCKNKKIPIIFTFSSVLGGLFYCFMNPYRLARLTSFIDFRDINKGAAYINNIISKIMDSSQFIGRTLNQDIINMISFDANDITFTLILCYFGWAAALFIIVLSIIFIISLFRNIKLIKNNYGKNIILGITISFLIQFTISIMMCLNLAPIIGVVLPFIGYKITSMITNMAMLGLISSIYSRKNLKKSFKKISL